MAYTISKLDDSTFLLYKDDTPIVELYQDDFNDERYYFVGDGGYRMNIYNDDTFMVYKGYFADAKVLLKRCPIKVHH